jgi:hypothetical protein
MDLSIFIFDVYLINILHKYYVKAKTSIKRIYNFTNDKTKHNGFSSQRCKEVHNDRWNA